MRSTLRNVVLLSVLTAATAAAQSPGRMGPRPGAGARGPGAPAAQLLLARTGELELTDAQVVRLAAIARRSEARRKAMRSAMDSARMRFEANPADTVARRQFRQRMQADLQRADEQRRADQRDAIAVLTPDQQARAWDMVANRGREMRGMRGPEMRQRMGGARRMGPPMGRARPERGPDRQRPRAQRPPEAE